MVQNDCKHDHVFSKQTLAHDKTWQTICFYLVRRDLLWQIFLIFTINRLKNPPEIYGTRLELVYTFCDFLTEFSRLDNETSQKTCINMYLFAYLPLILRKIVENSNIFLEFSQIVAHSNTKRTSKIRVQTASCCLL